METPDDFEFPFPPYDIQKEFMRNLYGVLEKRQLGIFESPTGTGKSLSIICAVVKWLKDHNQQERDNLKNEIEKLKTEKENISDNNTDWISTNSKEIELTRKINELRIQQNQITDYDKKITDIYAKKSKIEAKKKWMAHKKEETLQINQEEDEILLDESEENDNQTDDEDDKLKKFKPIKIFICSRTHSQLSQFITEISKTIHGSNLRVISLASRQNYCINSSVHQLKNHALMNEKCLELQKKTNKQITRDDDGKITKKKKGTNCKCPFYRQQAIEELRDLALIELQDIEDLVKNGRKFNACPFYASRLGVEDAEIILVPYNTILHKATRDANGIDLKDNIVIIDEAHNLLDAIIQMHNSELNYNQIKYTLLQLKYYKQRFHTRFSANNLLHINQLLFILNKLQQLLDRSDKTEIFLIEKFVCTAEIDNYNMFKLLQFFKESHIAQKLHVYLSKYNMEEEMTVKPKPKGVKHFLSSLQKKDVAQTKEETVKPVKMPENGLLSVISFLQSLTYSYKDGRIILHASGEKQQRKLQFLLLNPATNFEDLIKEARSIIVAGGTMKPISEFEDLFANSGAETGRVRIFACDHIIPQENILPIIVTRGMHHENLLFNMTNRDNLKLSLKQIIHECCKIIPGGIVVFFPSYKYENSLWEMMKDHDFGRRVFREPPKSNQVDEVLRQYSETVKKQKKALMLSVVGGKLSEGLNFADDLGRCVIVVGLPYANITAPDLKEKMSYLDRMNGTGAGQKFYENLCMKAVNQCIGRAVRHREDYASVLLLDQRFDRTMTKMNLPDWIKRSLEVQEFDEALKTIDRFFKNKTL